MLGLYVHTHWGYNHPYAARTWTLPDWTAYLDALKALGYDTVMIWPQTEAMPVPPTPSDVAFLEKMRQVIDLAHKRFGMQVLIVGAANVLFKPNSTNSTFENRSYWESARNVDPKDRDSIEAMLRARAVQWEPLALADGLVIIDSDPGGWPDSPSEDFVEFFRLQGDVMGKLNPKSKLYYWMWQGWPVNVALETYLKTLTLLKEKVKRPWEVFSCYDVHLEATDIQNMTRERTFFPYNLVEFEPSFPLINANAGWFRQEIRRYDPALYPGGLMINAQTHCLQIPRIYLSAHYALGGTMATEKMMVLAEKLIPGPAGVALGFAWQLMEDDRDCTAMRKYGAQLRKEAARSQKAGPLAGLMMMTPERYLQDVADNIDIRADFIELRIAIESGRELKKTLSRLLEHLKPYRDRLGYNYICWEGPLRKRMLDPLATLQVQAVNAAMWPPPDKIHPKGYLVHFLDVLEEYVTSLKAPGL